MSELRIRPAARAVVLDHDDRILLVRFLFPAGKNVWAAPGGGIEPGESPEDALRRELAEETGLVDLAVGPVVWTRLHIVPFIGGQWDGQHEQYHLVRTAAFTPKPRLVSLELAPRRARPVLNGRWEEATVEFTLTPRLGGLTGVMARVLGKMPPDTHVWIVDHDVPGFVRFEGPLYDGPVWRIDLGRPHWPDASR